MDRVLRFVLHNFPKIVECDAGEDEVEVMRDW